MLKSPARDVVVVHSSDLHVDHDYTARLHGGDGTTGLACVLAASRDNGADVVMLAGDTFDHHRVPQQLVERAAEVIAASPLPVVLLPGITHDEAIDFPELSLEIWGRAHHDYADMIPFESVRVRRTRWLIAMAHGHYEPKPQYGDGPRPSWLISDDEIAATGADYVALGHWNRPLRVGNGKVPAYYSGSPEFSGTINVVRLSEASGVTVTRAPLDIAREVTEEATE